MWAINSKPMNKSIASIFILFGMAFLLQNCTKAYIDETSPDDLPPLERTVIYNPEVASIIFNNCLTCHAGNTPSGSLDLSTYESVRFHMENGEMWQRLNDITDPMPPGGKLDAATLQIIDKWAQDGYPEN